MHHATHLYAIAIGSNRPHGRHGRGAALFAARWCGAQRGVAEGRTGQSYAIPTKDGHLRTLPIGEVESGVNRFIEYAAANPRTRFEVSRIGCGLAGYKDADIAPLFERAPDNCTLPYAWERILANPPPRIIVAGSRSFADYALLETSIAWITANLREFAIVSGTAQGADVMGERYAAEHDLECLRVPANWNRYGKAAGMMRNQRMSWMASHLIAYWDDESRGTEGMIRMAKADGLKGCVVHFKAASAGDYARRKEWIIPL